MKSDHRMNRCFLAGLRGDAINAVLAAAGSNLRKLLGLLREGVGRIVLALICWCQDLYAKRDNRRSLHLAAA